MRYFIAALFAASTLTTTAAPVLNQNDNTSKTTVADSWEKWGPNYINNTAEYKIRLGYSIGGTMPIPVPAEIRSINEFSPKGGINIGFEFSKMFSRRWGVNAGFHIFNQGFHTAADVKGYKMSITIDGNSMSGFFTGCDVTNMQMSGVSIPAQALFRISPRWNVAFGPYVCTYFKSSFEGEVYDNKDGVGYLRVDTPTGERVTIDRETPATYDFEEHMRSWGAGLELTLDWKAARHFNVFGMLDWGLSNAIDPDFDAVAFPMYPIYGTIGAAYRF